LNVVLAEHALLDGSKVESTLSTPSTAGANLILFVSVLVVAMIFPVILEIIEVIAILILVRSADTSGTASLIICVHVHLFD
jgi:ABC-type transport system involved in Fe-S cluster assembly fused permease/ATPase subunit